MKKRKILMEIYKGLEADARKTELFHNSIIIFFLVCFTYYFMRLSEQGIIFNNIFTMDAVTGLAIFAGLSVSLFFALKKTTGTFPIISGLLIWIHGFFYLTENHLIINFMQIGINMYMIFILIKVKTLIWELKGDLKSKGK